MPKEKGKCPCSESQTGARTPVGGRMEISPEAYQLLRNASIPSEFKEAVREVIPNVAMPHPPDFGSPATSPEIDMASMKMSTPRVSVPPVEMPVATVPVSWPEMSTLGRGGNAFYLTDLTLDLSGVAHMTPGLFALSFDTLAPFVNNNLACCPPMQEDGEEEGEEQTVDARFSSARIVTGYTVPVDKSTIKSDMVTLTVTPKRLAAEVELRIAGEDRATTVDIQRNTNAGTVTFRVKGKSATPADKRDGDTTVQAVVRGRVLATTKVVVVIPKAIATPHPTFDGVVTPVNRRLDTTTSPAVKAAQLSKGHVALVTDYTTPLTIPVNDQFGDRLNSIYVGTPVTERGGEVINQSMSEQGTYQDPVGPLVWPDQPPFTIPAQIPDSASPGQTIPNPAIATFLNGPPRPLPNPASGTQTIPVEVGGHNLNPAIVNRTIEFTPPDRLKITWP